MHSYFKSAWTALYVLAVATLLYGCGKEPEFTGAETSGGATKTLYARIEGAGEPTRTTYDSVDGKFSWTAGDQIAVHYSDGTYETLSVDPTSGTVDAPSTAGRKRDCYAVYPASAAVAAGYGNPELQVRYPDSYDISDIVTGSATGKDFEYSPCPMVARNDPESDILFLRHVGGLLRVKMPQFDQSSATVRFTFDKDVTGIYTVEKPGTDAPAVSTQGADTGRVVTVTLNQGAAIGSLSISAPFYINIPLPCGSYGEIRIEILDTSDNVLESTTVSRPAASGIRFDRRCGKQMSFVPSGPDSPLATPLTIEPIQDGLTTVNILNPGKLTYTWSIAGGSGNAPQTKAGSLQQGSTSDNPVQISVSKGQKLALYQGDRTKAAGTINLSAPCYVYGNVMSLVAGTEFMSQTELGVAEQFYNLFASQSNLFNHPEKDIILPATTLTSDCYAGMFAQCTSLERAPELPATTLADYCYQGMFSGCSSLTAAPELPATALAAACYWGMFSGCTSLTAAPELQAATLIDDCYALMFEKCIQLTTAPELPATTLADYCYQGMFSECSSLIAAPELPATALAAACYFDMFRGCTSLTTAPLLPATDLVYACYRQMFSGCTNLSRVECHADPEKIVDSSLENWLEGAGTGATGGCTIIINGNSTEFSIPENWNIVDPNAPYESTDYSADNSIYTLQTATKGAGIDIILMGDAYSDRQIADGTYDAVMRRTVEAFFSAEPYSSFRDHFNVYCIKKVSKNEGYYEGAENALGTYFENGSEIKSTNQNYIYNTLMPMVVSGDRLEQTLIIVLTNDDRYAGRCTQRWSPYYEGDWGAGAAIAYIAASSDNDEFIGLVTHEAGGHGFAKLADEYSYEYMGQIDAATISNRRERQAKGWKINIDFTSNTSQVLWKSFITDTRYASEGVGVFEGGDTYWTGVWRPTEDSKMRYNDGEFNAPSRYAIWRRIHKLAYGSSWNGTYEDFVTYDMSVRTPATRSGGLSRRNYVEKARLPLAPPEEIPYEPLP